MTDFVFSISFFSIFAVVLLWVTVRGKESWPFSCYPMFSHPMSLSDAVVFRLALELKSGEVEWWKPEYPRYQRRAGKTVQEIYRRRQNNIALGRLPSLNHYLSDVADLIKHESGSIEPYQAIHIIQRRISVDSKKQWHVDEELIERVPLSELHQKA